MSSILYLRIIDSQILIAGAPNDERKQRRSDREVARPVGTDEEGNSFDTVSLSSLGPNATTIKVPYKQVTEHETKTASLNRAKPKEEHKTHLNVQLKDRKKKPNSEDMQLHEDIESLRKRLNNISSNDRLNTITRDRSNAGRPEREADYFDYRTIVATVQPTPRQQVVDAYNVKVIEHSSPFRLPQQSVNELENSINRLESLSSELSTKIVLEGQPRRRNAQEGDTIANNNNQNDSLYLDNNNEANFNIADYLKYDITAATVEGQQTTRIEAMDNDDAISLVSSCSLQSARTYDVRALDEPAANDPQQVADEELNDEKHFPVETVDFDGEQEGDRAKRAAAWIFDPNDGSTTAIVAPPQPRKPEPPKIEAKTEELAQSRGGRSYYLELLEADKREAEQKRPSSIDSLYSRWNSHSTLSTTNNNQHSEQLSRHLTTPVNKTPINVSSTSITRKSRQRLPASVLDLSTRKRPASSTGNNANRSSLPFGGPPLSNRSRSSSCLVSSTRPSKYSIYGGLKRTNDGNKPVPRLSYSRAIGPKSQRQIDAQPKTPSRYLKMK